MTAERAMTVEEFERIAPLLDGPSELVDGRLRLMSPTGFAHGVLALRIGAALDRYAEEHAEAGEAVGAETGFRIDDPHHPVQAPDAAFVGVNRISRIDAGGTQQSRPPLCPGRTRFGGGGALAGRYPYGHAYEGPAVAQRRLSGGLVD